MTNTVTINTATASTGHVVIRKSTKGAFAFAAIRVNNAGGVQASFNSTKEAAERQANVWKARRAKACAAVADWVNADNYFHTIEVVPVVVTK